MLRWRRGRSIFISYRRETGSGYAGRIRDQLTKSYGDANVFMDVDSIGPGRDFVDTLDQALDSCHAVVVVIDPGWASVTGADGIRRLDNEDDWVRAEIAAALTRAEAHDLHLIPMRVGGAEFPPSQPLPAAISTFTRYNAVELRDAHFEKDLDEVIRQIGRGWRRLVQVGAAAVAVATLVAILGWLVLRDTSPPDGPVDLVDQSPMIGDLNVAVADFTTLDDDGDVIIDDEVTVDDDIARNLIEELSGLGIADFTFDVREPPATGFVDGLDVDERAESAGLLAEKLRASVVIYGFRDPTAPQALTPEFYVANRNLADAVELAGRHAIGARIVENGELDLAARRLLRQELLARTDSLTSFVVGLVALQSDDPDEALDWFNGAVDAVDAWDTPSGSEVFHLFVARSHLRLDQFDEADAALQRALALNPSYARAVVGIAEVEFQRSKGLCTASTTDADGLESALLKFDTAATASDQPPSAHIRTKVALGRGRVMVCRSQAGLADEWEQARTELIAVVEEFQAGADELAELASLAHASLALIAFPVVGDDTPADELLVAMGELEAAYQLTTSVDAKESYAALLGHISDRLGNEEATAMWCSLTTEACPRRIDDVEVAGEPEVAAEPDVAAEIPEPDAAPVDPTDDVNVVVEAPTDPNIAVPPGPRDIPPETFGDVTDRKIAFTG